MTSEQFTEYLLLIVGVWCLGETGVLGLLWDMSGSETVRERRTPFGRALRGVFAGLVLIFLILGVIFLLRFVSGPDGTPIEPPAITMILRVLLVISLLIVTVYDVRLYRAIRERRRRGDDYVISNEGVFGTLAQAMPIIVADHKGIIQHTTPVFDELAKAMPGELIGKDLKVIMPERYAGQHDTGMEHYVRTRQARIVGTVVTVEMMRRDGTEIPIYLALNTTDVDGVPWFVAAIWEKEPQTPETLISSFSNDVAETITHTATDVEEVKADVKELKRINEERQP